MKPNEKNDAPGGQRKPGGEGKFDQLFGNKRFSLVFSLLAAVVLWAIVVTLQPNTEVEISGVRVNWDYNTAGYSYRQLDIVEKPETTVRLKVNGDGSVINSLRASDFFVYPDYSSVTSAGTYELKLLARADSSISMSSSVNVLEILPADTIEVTFEEVTTKTLPIEVDTSALQVPATYYADTAVASPDEVTLRGPKSEVDKIAKAVAKLTLPEEEYTSSILNMANLEYWDADGQPVTGDRITADVEQVEVTVNIYKIKEVPLDIQYFGLPSGYDTTQLKATLSRSTIRIGGTEEQLEQISKIDTSYADMTKFDPGVTQSLTPQIPEGVINVDNVQTVVVSFNTTDFDSKTFAVTDIRPINTPKDVKVTVTTEAISEVKLVGKREELEELSPASIVAQVDVSSITAGSGQTKMQVTIVVPGSQSVFAVGTYSVLCIGESVE